MKLTVTDWTRVQNQTPDNDLGNRVYDYIEYRTYGKRWAQEVAIRIPPEFRDTIAEACRAAGIEAKL